MKHIDVHDFDFLPIEEKAIASFVILTVAKLWVKGLASLNHQGCLNKSHGPSIECNYKFKLLHVWQVDVQAFPLEEIL